MTDSATWDIRPLSTLVNERGISYGIVQPGEEVPGGVPVVRVNNMSGNRIETSDVKRVSKTIEENYSRTRLRGGEVLLSLVGTLGLVAKVPSELSGWNVARAVGVLPFDNHHIAEWVAIVLKSEQVQHFIRTRATTTVQATFNLRDVADIPIPMPPPAVRNQIVEISSALDDKIELNRRMNETLEAMARAIFKSWFVDFDPVRAKSEGRKPAGMDEATAALFPNSFQPSPLGSIPKGWLAVPLSSLVELVRENLDPGDQPTQFFEHFSLPAFDEGQAAKVERGDTIKSNKNIVPKQAVLLSKLNPRIPRIWLAEPTGKLPAVCSTEFFPLQAKSPATREFVFGIVCSQTFQDTYATLVTGTSSSHQRVQPDSMLAMPSVQPTNDVVGAYSNLVRPFLELQAANRRECKTLAELRDTLLPKLLSGEVAVT